MFQTAHYRIHTDLDDDLAVDLGRRLDGMYDEYSRRLAGFTRFDVSTPFEAYLVQTQEKYLHLAGLGLAGTGGAFISSRHLLAAFLDGQGRDALRRTLQHEAFHQFVASAIGHNVPIWLNEGLAQVFEEGIWTGDGFLLGQVPPRRVRELNQDIAEARLIDFPRFLSMTPEQWAANWHTPDLCARQYNQAWAMAHCLVYATDEQGRPKYRARLINMLKLLHDGADGQAAFTASFSSNLSGFQERFTEFVGSLTCTPEATLIDNQTVLADLMIQMQKKGLNLDTFDQFRVACITQGWRMQYKSGNLQWKSAADPIVYFRSPTGQPLNGTALTFEYTRGRPLPDLVCRCEGLTLRTRFSNGVGGKMEHETVVEGG